jgi:hypothetical protein
MQVDILLRLFIRENNVMNRNYGEEKIHSWWNMFTWKIKKEMGGYHSLSKTSLKVCHASIRQPYERKVQYAQQDLWYENFVPNCVQNEIQ